MEKISKKDISVIIQGPLDNRTYEAIDCYQDFGEVIVSTWEGENLELLNPATGRYELIMSRYPDGVEGFVNVGSAYYVAHTTLAGVNASNHPYVLKTRSDELYPNLDKFLDNFYSNTGRVHTTDNGFWKNIDMAFSNHLFLGETERVRKCCSMLMDYCRGASSQDIHFCSAEKMLGFFLCLSFDRDPQKEDWRQIFRDVVYITPCSDLPDHLHSGQSSSNYAFKRAKNYPEGRKDRHDPRLLFTHHTQI
jgi:hypothetical protein